MQIFINKLNIIKNIAVIVWLCIDLHYEHTVDIKKNLHQEPRWIISELSDVNFIYVLRNFGFIMSGSVGVQTFHAEEDCKALILKIINSKLLHF